MEELVFGLTWLGLVFFCVICLLQSWKIQALKRTVKELSGLLDKTVCENLALHQQCRSLKEAIEDGETWRFK